MGTINIAGANLDRLLADNTRTPGTAYQRAFEELARTHRGRPVAEITARLRRAADDALLGFTHSDLREQATAISTGQRYVLRVTVT